MQMRVSCLALGKVLMQDILCMCMLAYLFKLSLLVLMPNIMRQGSGVAGVVLSDRTLCGHTACPRVSGSLLSYG